MLPPRPQAYAFTFALAWLLALADAPAQNERSKAYNDYRDYLNYHQTRISGERHPDKEVQKKSAARAAALAPAVEKLDLEAIRTAIKLPGNERTRILKIMISAKNGFTPKLLDAEAELLALAKLRDDEDTPDEQKPEEETLTRLETKIDWLQEQIAFLEKEIFAIAGEPDDAQVAADLYSSLVSLEEANLVAKNLADPEKKRRAEAAAQIQSQRLRGQSLAGARANLPRRQAALAARKFATQVKTIDKRLTALANRYPEESARLTALRELYQAEITELKTMHQKRREK